MVEQRLRGGVDHGVGQPQREGEDKSEPEQCSLGVGQQVEHAQQRDDGGDQRESERGEPGDGVAALQGGQRDQHQQGADAGRPEDEYGVFGRAADHVLDEAGHEHGEHEEQHDAGDELD